MHYWKVCTYLKPLFWCKNCAKQTSEFQCTFYSVNFCLDTRTIAPRKTGQQRRPEGILRRPGGSVRGNNRGRLHDKGSGWLHQGASKVSFYPQAQRNVADSSNLFPRQLLMPDVLCTSFLCSVKREDYLETVEFLNKLAENLEKKMKRWLRMESAKIRSDSRLWHTYNGLQHLTSLQHVLRNNCNYASLRFVWICNRISWGRALKRMHLVVGNTVGDHCWIQDLFTWYFLEIGLYLALWVIFPRSFFELYLLNLLNLVPKETTCPFLFKCCNKLLSLWLRTCFGNEIKCFSENKPWAQRWFVLDWFCQRQRQKTWIQFSFQTKSKLTSWVRFYPLQQVFRVVPPPQSCLLLVRVYSMSLQTSHFASTLSHQTLRFACSQLSQNYRRVNKFLSSVVTRTVYCFCEVYRTWKGKYVIRGSAVMIDSCQQSFCDRKISNATQMTFLFRIQHQLLSTKSNFSRLLQWLRQAVFFFNQNLSDKALSNFTIVQIVWQWIFLELNTNVLVFIKSWSLARMNAFSSPRTKHEHG